MSFINIIFRGPELESQTLTSSCLCLLCLDITIRTLPLLSISHCAFPCHYLLCGFAGLTNALDLVLAHSRISIWCFKDKRSLPSNCPNADLSIIPFRHFVSINQLTRTTQEQPELSEHDGGKRRGQGERSFVLFLSLQLAVTLSWIPV